MRTARHLLPLLALSALVACAQKVQAPVADAGPDATVNTGAFVQLTGKGTDPQGRALAFAWTFAKRPLGSTATLTDAQTATPSFLADVPGQFELQLVVSNSILLSSPDTVVITATTCGATAPV
ncbi:MAG TPA: PKD domain-containing protein, partial [Solirubrobacterales bacterium]|nr:PKD domain-containing protein [Solirubrobacterales bacterium]